MTDRKTCIDFCANKDVWTAPRVHRETSAQTNLRKLSVSYVQYNIRHFLKYLYKEGRLCLFGWDQCLSTDVWKVTQIIAFTIKSWTLINNQLRMESQTSRLCNSHIHTLTRSFRTNLMLLMLLVNHLSPGLWVSVVLNFMYIIQYHIYTIPRCNSITRGVNINSIECQFFNRYGNLYMVLPSAWYVRGM